MKFKNYFIALLIGIFAMGQINAQIADGSIAPDFTATDINGNTHNLYSYLNAGKDVVIDISATWCGPCWNYHQAGHLEDVWDTYGPPGTDEVMVFWIEGDAGTSVECIWDGPGCTGGTVGDWTAGVDYPIIDSAPIANAFNISYYPTVFVICASTKKVYEAGQIGVAAFEDWFYDSCPMSAVADVEDAICFEEGGIDLTTYLGYGSLSFDWSNGSNYEDLENIGPGTYSVTVTDQHNVEIELLNLVVEGTDTPISTYESASQEPECFGETNGSITVSAENGTGPYSYQWSNGDFGPTASNLPAGDYTVVVTDANLCQNEETFSIEEPEELEISSFVYDATCSEFNGEIELEGFGGTGANYMFDIGDGYSSQSAYTDLEPGTYDISVIDENGCETFDIAYIFAGQNPDVEAGEDAVISCSEGEIELDGSGSSEGSSFAYLWDTEDGNILDGELTLNPTVDAAGTYTLTVFHIYDGCEVIDQVVVTSEGTAPALSVATPDMITCEITSITIDASASDSGDDYVITWSTSDGNIVSGEGTLTPVVDAAGTYTLTIDNLDNDCSSTMDIVVQADVDLPVFTVAPYEISCADPIVEICITAVQNVDNVIWEDGSEGLCKIVNASGVYTFTAYAENECAAEGEIEVTSNDDIPSALAGDDQLLTCTLNSITLDGSGSSQGDDFSYEWTDADGNVLGTEVTLDVTSPGTYILIVTNNVNGCSNADIVVVEEFINTPDPVFTSELNYNVLTLTGTSDTDEESTWTCSNGETASGTNASFTFTESGDYEICHTVNNECGSETSCETITVAFQPLSVDVSILNITCPGILDGSIDISALGGVTPYSISWTGPNNFVSSEFNITELASGEYTMTLTDDAGNVITETYTVVQPDPFDVIVNVTDEVESNANGAIDVNITGGTPPYTFSWSNGMSNEDIDNLSSGTYTLVITDANGCEYSVDVIVESVTNNIDLPFVQSFTIQPNPTFDEVNVDIIFDKEVEGRIMLLNKLGQLISSDNVTSKDLHHTIDLGALDSGIYFVRFETTDGAITKKVVKL